MENAGDTGYSHATGWWKSSAQKYSNQYTIDNRAGNHDILAILVGQCYVGRHNATDQNIRYFTMRVLKGTEATGGTPSDANTTVTSRGFISHPLEGSNNNDKQYVRLTVLGFVKVRAGYMRKVRASFQCTSSTPELQVSAVKINYGAR